MVLNAVEFGVPQMRERVIIIGINKSWRKMAVPQIRATHYGPDSEKKTSDGLMPYVTIGEAIGDLPSVCARVTWTGLSDTETRRQREKNKEINYGAEKLPFPGKLLNSTLIRFRNRGLNFSVLSGLTVIRISMIILPEVSR